MPLVEPVTIAVGNVASFTFSIKGEECELPICIVIEIKLWLF